MSLYLQSLPVIMSHRITNIKTSRNPFADPGCLTFADLIQRLKADHTLRKRDRDNEVWALRAVARAVNRDPAAIPAHRSSCAKRSRKPLRKRQASAA